MRTTRRGGELKRGIIHRSCLASVGELELELELIEALMVVGDAVMAFTVCRCSTSTGPKASTESSV